MKNSNNNSEHLSCVKRKQDFCLCENKAPLFFADLTISLLTKSKFQASISCLLLLHRPVWSDLVGNPEDQFSRVTAHLSHIMRKTDYSIYSHGLLCVIVHHFQIYVLVQFDKRLTWKSKLMLGIMLTCLQWLKV